MIVSFSIDFSSFVFLMVLQSLQKRKKPVTVVKQSPGYVRKLIPLKRKDARQKSFLLNVSNRTKKDTNVQIPSESVKRSCVSEI